MEKQTVLTAAQEKLAALGFKVDRRIGMNVLSLAEGDTAIVKIKGMPFVFEAKDGRTFDAVLVDNVETGEADQTMWLSGQLKSQLLTQADGFIGGIFAITHKGKVEAMVPDEETGQKVKRQVNQFDILALTEDTKLKAVN